MKTATLPPLRVEPQLRKAVERLLEPGETLSTFVEQAIRQSVERRQADAEFGARALASRKKARSTGRYHSAGDVLAALEAQVASARRPGRRR
jgi:hypothetical protein